MIKKQDSNQNFRDKTSGCKTHLGSRSNSNNNNNTVVVAVVVPNIISSIGVVPKNIHKSTEYLSSHFEGLDPLGPFRDS
jgi:hypothetical protein